MIIGPGNAGKSTLAVEIGKILHLPVYHLDKYFWEPNWEQKDMDVWHSHHAALIRKPLWVIDGDFSKLYDERAERADTIIFLNFPLRILIPRFLRRVYKYRGSSRPDMTEGNIESVNLEYLRWLYRYDRKKRLDLISKYKDSKQTLVLINPSEVKSFLKSLTPSL